MRPDRLLASPRLTIAGFILLAAGVLASQWLVSASVWLIAGPLFLLALNLSAALWQLPRLRHRGLGVFHFCLLGCLLLLAVGRLTHFDGRLPVVDGQEFDPAAVETVARGPWHADGYLHLAFKQGPFTVNYAPGVRRERTTSLVALGQEGALRWQEIGDDTPLKLDGYRFYTTSNKGFAPILTWSRPGQTPVTGAVMLPSYPANDWQQAHKWAAPRGPEWQFWLRPALAVDETIPWTLDPRRTDSVLIAEANGQRFELRPGEEARTESGALRYEWLAGWMGYRIFYDPTLLPLLVLSVLGVLGMAQHLWSAPTPRPVRDTAANRAGNVTEVRPEQTPNARGVLQ
jgi:hypothetical protein